MSIRVSDTTIAPGEKKSVRFKLGSLLTGGDVTITVHVVNGRKAGKKLGLISTTHGSEFFSIEYVRRVLLEVNPAELSGTLIAVSLANPLAFQQNSTVAPGDELNMNRFFPGKSLEEQKSSSYHGGPTETMAGVISENLIRKVDCLLDFHLGGWGQAIYCVDLPDVGGKMDGSVNDLARSFGLEVIHKWKQPPGTSVSYSTSIGIPGIGVEVGGGGFGKDWEAKWVAITLRGVVNVMRSLEMLRGQLELPKRQYLLTERAGIWPTSAGFHIPEVGPDLMGQIVNADQLLSCTYNAESLEKVQEFRNPYQGVLYCVRATGPIRMGEWSYLVGDLKHAEVIAQKP